MIDISTEMIRELDCPLPLDGHRMLWESGTVAATLQQLKQQSEGAEIICLKRGRVKPDEDEADPVIWPVCAVAAAVAPSCLLLEGQDVVGEHKLICTPFPIDAGGCDCGIDIEVHETERQAIVTVTIDPMQIDYLKFDSIVTPPVTKGMRVFLRGSLPLPVAVSLVLSHMPIAESIWVQERVRSGCDVCVYANKPELLGTHSSEKIPMTRSGGYE